MTHQDDLAKIPVNSLAEIYFYMNDRLRHHKKFFYCGNDLFYLNDFAHPRDSEEEHPDAKNMQKKQALDWLLNEDMLKTEFSNPFTFVTEVLKKYIWTKDQQAIILCGEKQSGKSTNLLSVLEMIYYYNDSSFVEDNFESIKNRKQSQKQRVHLLEHKISTEKALEIKELGAILETALSKRNKLTLKGNDINVNAGANNSDANNTNTTLLNSIASEHGLPDSGVQNKEESYRLFNEKLSKAHKIINAIVQIYHGNDSFSNGASFKLLLDADESSKFVKFSYNIHLLQTFKLILKVN